MAEQGLTERQKKWFASVQASLERDTGKTLDQWVAIARTCPETRPKSRADWLREHHGLGVNRAAHVLSVAFPQEDRWDDADALRTKLWTNPASTAILEALEAAIAELPKVICGQRKGFTAFSRNFQFASARPIRDGGLRLGLALDPQHTPGLEPAAKSEGWSERLTAVRTFRSPSEIDAEIKALLRASWERS